jgi:hypothetical protein
MTGSAGAGDPSTHVEVPGGQGVQVGDHGTQRKAGIASGDAASAETATAIVSLCITAGIDLRDALATDQ